MDDTFIKIENVFRKSSSPEELFDAFREAISLPINDISTYKILLSNPALSSDEVKMFSEKLIEQFPQNSYETLLWTGKIFENHNTDLRILEDSIRYYKRAYFVNRLNEESLIHLINLYRSEFFLFDNIELLDFIESSVITVNKKSKIYFLLSDIYRQKGNIKKAEHYLLLSQKCAERES